MPFACESLGLMECFGAVGGPASRVGLGVVSSTCGLFGCLAAIGDSRGGLGCTPGAALSGAPPPVADRAGAGAVGKSLFGWADGLCVAGDGGGATGTLSAAVPGMGIG